MDELVLDCVMPYIDDKNDLNSVLLVSRRYRDIDSSTRKHVTLHVHFLPNPSRLFLRFPNLESLTLKTYSHGRDYALSSSILVTPWIQEISVKFTHLKSLSIRNMVVFVSDLQLLARTLGYNLRSLEIYGFKMISEDGLVNIARYCKDLRSLRLDGNEIDRDANGKWLHELALEVFNHSKKLDHFGYGIINKDWDYIGFEFPQNIRGLRIEELHEDQFPFLHPYLNQLRELDLKCGVIDHNCQCLLFQNCPSLEVLHAQDICGDGGLQIIGQFYKKLHKLNHDGWVTQTGLIALAQGFLGEEEGITVEYGHNLRNLSLSYTGGSDVGLLELSKGYIKDKGDAGYHGVLTRLMVSDHHNSISLLKKHNTTVGYHPPSPAATTTGPAIAVVV
uniref:COI1 F-box domain-containing protein n=1 Tax=Tanacetum cinerariifolium TaxID=118510 RepID=A0A699JE55_TANCI|nr:hypothetical protein [Tanacetum cinerariifolium]